MTSSASSNLVRGSYINQVFSSKDAHDSIYDLASVDNENVSGLKPSYSNDGKRIYVSTSGAVTRLFGTLISGPLTGYNQDHKNLMKAVESICASVQWDLVGEMSAAELSLVAQRVADAAKGLQLVFDTHYKAANEHFKVPQKTLELLAKNFENRAQLKQAADGLV